VRDATHAAPIFVRMQKSLCRRDNSHGAGSVDRHCVRSAHEERRRRNRNANLAL